MEKSKIIIISIVAILILAVVLMFMSVGSKDEEEEGNLDGIVLTTENSTNLSYKDMMEKEEGQLFQNLDNETNPYAKESEDLKNLINELNSGDETDSLNTGFYENENDAIIKEMENDIMKMNNTKNTYSPSNKTQQQNYSSQNNTQQQNYTPEQNYSPQNNARYNDNITVPAQVESVVEEPVKKRRVVTKSTTNQNLGGNNKTSTSSDMIHAVIHNGNKAIKTGSTVRIRIVEDCIINGNEIKKNTMVSAIANLTAERIELKISSILYGGNYINTKLLVYDMDGIQGAYVPGGIKQVAKEDVSSEGVNDLSKNVPVVGGFASDIFKKSVKEPSAILYDNHKINLKFSER